MRQNTRIEPRPDPLARPDPGTHEGPGAAEDPAPSADPRPDPTRITSTTPVTAGLTIRFLRRLAVAEAFAFLTLITIAVIHSTTGGAGLALFIIGNVHGAVFTTYLVSIFIFQRKLDWGPLTLLLVLIAGFIPGGGLMAERWALSDSHIRPPKVKAPPTP
jgi:integral membrane protein